MPSRPRHVGKANYYDFTNGAECCPTDGNASRMWWCDTECVTVEQKEYYEARNWFCPITHTGVHTVQEDGYQDTSTSLNYIGMVFGMIQGIMYGIGPSIMDQAINREIARALEEERAPRANTKLAQWIIGFVVYSGAGLFGAIGLGMGGGAIVAPFIGLAVPVNLLGEKYMLGVEPSKHAIVAAFIIISFVGINAVAAPAIQVCVQTCEDAGRQTLDYVLSGGGNFEAWIFWVSFVGFWGIFLLMWEIKLQIKKRNPEHNGIPALYGMMSGFFGGASGYTFAVLGKVSLIFGPGTADPVNGYRDISGDKYLLNMTSYRYGTDGTDGFQHVTDAGMINLDMGGGTPCWHFLTSYGWYFWLPFAAIFLQQQARWLNHGIQHFGCDVVVPCEIVMNMLSAQYCFLFLGQECNWFDYNLFVRNDHTLYDSIIGLYCVGIGLGFISLIILGFTPRRDDYVKPDNDLFEVRGQTSEDACGFEWLTKWSGRPPRVLALTPEAEQKLHKLSQRFNPNKSEPNVDGETNDAADDQQKTADEVVRL